MFKKSNQEIYLDFMASTPVDKEVARVWAMSEEIGFANPSSLHSSGVRSHEIYQKSLKIIATNLKCPPSSLIVTSGATESNAIAIQGVVNYFKKNNPDQIPHIIISTIEHPSISGITKLSDQGIIELSFLPVDKEGIVKVSELRNLLKENTILVSVMFVNSEIGTIQPLNAIKREINRYVKNNNPINRPVLHTDASQALLTLGIELNKLHVDLLTLNGHKIYAPTGIGILYVNHNIKDHIEPLFISNYEKTYLRPGTIPTALVVALAKAVELASKKRNEFIKKVSLIQSDFINDLQSLGGEINGSITDGKRVPTNVSVTFDRINHQFLQMQLDAVGIYCATRSACLDRGKEGSAVLAALSNSKINAALRFSFGYETTKAQLDVVIMELQKALEIQRLNQ